MNDADTHIASRSGNDRLRGAKSEVRTEKVRSPQFEPFRPRGAQDIPPALMKKFTDEGYHLHWIRISIQGDDDSENIADAYHKGYSPVDVNDIPENLKRTMKITNVAGFEGLVVSKDTGLFKIPLERYKEIRNFYQRMADDQIQGANDLIRESAKQHGLEVKLQDESFTKVALGENARKATVQQDDSDE